MLSAPHPAAAGGLQPSGPWSGGRRPWPHGRAMEPEPWAGGNTPGAREATTRHTGRKFGFIEKRSSSGPDGAALSTVLCSIWPSYLNAKLQDKNPIAMIFEVVLLLASGEGWEVYQSVSMLIETCQFFAWINLDLSRLESLKSHSYIEYLGLLLVTNQLSQSLILDLNFTHNSATCSQFTAVVCQPP